jgi:molybdopterin synthase sulfur carrier subunit
MTAQETNVAPITVVLPSQLRDKAGTRALAICGARTVGEVIREIDAQRPGIGLNLCHETGELRPFVNVFVGTENIRFMDGLETEVKPGDMIHIIHSIAGGCHIHTSIEETP